METIAGVVVGALIAWLAGRDRFRYETDWDRRQLLREKLEDIGALADEVNAAFREHVVKFMGAIAQGDELRLGAEVPFARLTLLVGIYAPELRPELDAVIAARDSLGPDVAEALIQPERDAHATGRAMAGILTAWRDMHTACENLAERAAESARDHYGLTGDFETPTPGFLARWRRS